RPDAAEQVRQFGGDRVVLQGDNLRQDIEKALAARSSVSFSISWEDLPPVNWLGGSNPADQSLSMHFSTGGQNFRRNSCLIILTSTDFGSATGCAARPILRFRSSIKNWPNWWRMARCPRPLSKCTPRPVQAGDRSFAKIEPQRKDPVQIRRRLISRVAGTAIRSQKWDAFVLAMNRTIRR